MLYVLIYIKKRIVWFNGRESHGIWDSNPNSSHEENETLPPNHMAFGGIYHTATYLCGMKRFLAISSMYIYFATGHVRLCALQSKLIKCLLLSSLSSLSIASFLRGKQSVSHYIHAESPSLPYLYTLQIHMILVYCFCPGQYTWVMLSAHKIW